MTHAGAAVDCRITRAAAGAAVAAADDNDDDGVDDAHLMPRAGGERAKGDDGAAAVERVTYIYPDMTRRLPQPKLQQ